MTRKEIEATLRDMAETYSDFYLVEFKNAIMLYLNNKYSITLTDYDLAISEGNFVPNSVRHSSMARYSLDTIEEIIIDYKDMNDDRYLVLNGKGYRYVLFLG